MKSLPGALLLLVALALLLSGLHPRDVGTWCMETAPIFIAAPVLLLTHRRFPLSTLLTVLIALHALVLLVGGHYTYAEVPLGFHLQEWFSLARNPYDRIGHFFQGLVPALVAREVLLRKGFVRGRRMAGFLSVCVALAISASYEMIEWWAALLLGQGADQFLGTQGDPWDTQWDMAMALLGSSFAMLALAGLHDRSMTAVHHRTEDTTS